MDTFPFSIRFVLQQDAPCAKNYSRRNNCADIDCPVCSHKGKLHVDYEKNVFRCNACGEAGGVIKLHQLFSGISDSKQAYADLARLRNELPQSERSIKCSDQVKQNPKVTYIDLRDKVYSNLLSTLALSEAHKKDLIKRGLSPDFIARAGYKSLPVFGFCTLAELSLWKSCNVSDFQEAMRFWMNVFSKNGGSCIPGYYSLQNEFRIVRRKNGYFVPVRDRLGRISGMQIRYDALPDNASEKEKEMYHKYSWFSSSEKTTGVTVTGIETIHHVGFDPKSAATPEIVYLTEGALKADVASELSGGKPFIALIGVNNSAQLKNELIYMKDHGTKKIHVAVDMDYREKQTVKKALDNILGIIRETGLESLLLTWPDSYKGIDDFLLEYKKRGGKQDILK